MDDQESMDASESDMVISLSSSASSSPEPHSSMGTPTHAASLPAALTRRLMELQPDNSDAHLPSRCGTLSLEAIRTCRLPSVPRWPILEDGLHGRRHVSSPKLDDAPVKQSISPPDSAPTIPRTSHRLGTSAVCLPRRPHDKPRRLLAAPGRNPIIVTSHGFLDEIDVEHSR
jgi:hypothetical protein